MPLGISAGKSFVAKLMFGIPSTSGKARPDALRTPKISFAASIRAGSAASCQSPSRERVFPASFGLCSNGIAVGGPCDSKSLRLHGARGAWDRKSCHDPPPPPDSGRLERPVPPQLGPALRVGASPEGRRAPCVCSSCRSAHAGARGQCETLSARREESVNCLNAQETPGFPVAPALPACAPNSAELGPGVVELGSNLAEFILKSWPNPVRSVSSGLRGRTKATPQLVFDRLRRLAGVRRFCKSQAYVCACRFPCPHTCVDA